VKTKIACLRESALAASSARGCVKPIPDVDIVAKRIHFIGPSGN